MLRIENYHGQECRKHEIGYATASIVNSTFGIKVKVAGQPALILFIDNLLLSIAFSMNLSLLYFCNSGII